MPKPGFDPAEDMAPDAADYWADLIQEQRQDSEFCGFCSTRHNPKDHCEPAHHLSHQDCAACGAKWEPIPAESGKGHSMQHAEDCAYIAALEASNG